MTPRETLPGQKPTPGQKPRQNEKPAASPLELSKEIRELNAQIKALRARKKVVEGQLTQLGTLMTSAVADPRPIERGHIFWHESDGVGQEEQGRHPWIVLSNNEFHHKEKLVMAVPCTSNPFGSAFDEPIQLNDFTSWPVEPHSDRLLREGDKIIRIAKARKVSHFAISEVVPVGQVTSRATLLRITARIASAIR